MSKSNFLNSLSRAVHKVGFGLKKNSPEILVVTGVIGVVTAGVLACKATTKAGEIAEEFNDNMEQINEISEKVSLERYPTEQRNRDKVIVYTQTAVKYAKLYGPSVLLGAASLACILSSHRILSKRNVALAAAYATIEKNFKEYRGHLVERFGKDLDKELRYNIRAKEIEVTEVDEDGNETTVTKVIQTADIDGASDYAKFFDELCVGWHKDPEYNLTFLKQQQSAANEILQRRGYIFLNEVYDLIGVPRTRAGQIVGWVYDEKHPTGDNYVDFGIYDVHNEQKRAFVNGLERAILLDFNVDGNIYDTFRP